MRQRIEDLGRIAVLVDKLLDHDFWSEYDTRPKDFGWWFNEQTEEEREKIIDHFAYGRRSISEALAEIAEIANGWDVLNQEKEQ